MNASSIEVAALRVAASRGSSHAQFWLAKHFLTGNGAAEDDREASRLFKAAADAGHFEAHAALIRMWHDDRDTERPRGTDWVEWLRGAAERGVIDAQIEMWNQDVRDQKPGAFDWLRKAGAAVRGRAYYSPREVGVETDRSGAHSIAGIAGCTPAVIGDFINIRPHEWGEYSALIKTLSEGGFGRAAVLAATTEFAACGSLMEKDSSGRLDEQVVMRFMKARFLPALRLAAERGSAWAQFELGEMYLKVANSVQPEAEDLKLKAEMDQSSGVRLIRSAAELGHPAARNRFARILAKGVLLPRDDRGAARYLELAANQGVPEAQATLGEWYAVGRGLPKNPTAADRWLRSAADGGVRRAQLSLGLRLVGDGRSSQECNEGVDWLTRALGGLQVSESKTINDILELKAEEEVASLGAEDQLNTWALLGRLHAEGHCGTQNFSKAVEWHRKAAERNSVDSILFLASAYRHGQGVLQDFDEALRWYRDAADRGSGVACGAIAEMLEAGEGSPKDFVLAHVWYNHAAAKSSGDRFKQYSAARDRLASKMTSIQVAEAQRRAKQ